MMSQKIACIFQVLILILVLGFTNSIEIGTDCNSKDFICVDQTSFLVCIDDGSGLTSTVDQEAQTCSLGNLCDNELEIECGATSEVTQEQITEEQVTQEQVTEEQVTEEEEEVTQEQVTEGEVTQGQVTEEQVTGDQVTEINESNTEEQNEETTTQASEEPEKPEPSLAFECVAPGKFPDADDCEKYYLCIWTPFGIFKFDGNCAGLSYDPILRKCSNDATNCNAETFKCSEPGRFEDPANAQQYFLCSFFKDQLAQYNLRCPFLTIFDKVEQKCTSEFFPGVVSSTEENDSNQQKPVEPENTGEGGANEQGSGNEGNKSEESVEIVKVKFACAGVGTFADPNNPAKYFVCTLKKKDKLKKKSMKCAKGQSFDETTLACTETSTPATIDVQNDDAAIVDTDDEHDE